MVADTAPAPNAKQHIVSALGGTQGTATAHSISNPFTATYYRPAVLQRLPVANPVTGLRGAVPNNLHRLLVRKGGNAAAGVPVTAIADIGIRMPAGMETYSPDEVKAFFSFLSGLIVEELDDIYDTIVTGAL
jgi:hypothetical protein